MDTCWVLDGGISCQTSEKIKKKPSIKPSQRSLEASKLIQNKMRCEIYTSRWCKPISKSNVAVTEANHVLDLSIIVSTRRMEPTISKTTVSDEVSVLAKSRSKEGSRELEDLTLKSHKERLFLKNTLSKTQEHSFLRNVG